MRDANAGESMTNGDLHKDRIDALLRRFSERVATFVDREDQLEQEFARLNRSAEVEFTSSSSELEPQITSELEMLEKEYSDRAAWIHKALETAKRQINERCDRRREAIKARGQHQEDVARYKFQEVNWISNNAELTERKEAEARHHQASTRLDAANELLTLLEKEADTLLRNFRAMIPSESEPSEAESEAKPEALLEMLDARMGVAEATLAKLRDLAFPKLFGKVRASLLVVLLVVLHVGAFGVFQHLSAPPELLKYTCVSLAVVVGVVLLCRLIAGLQIKRTAIPLAIDLRAARGLHGAGIAAVDAALTTVVKQSASESKRITGEAHRVSQVAVEAAGIVRDRRLPIVERARKRLLGEVQADTDRQLATLEQERLSALEALAADSEQSLDALSEAYAGKAEQLQARQQAAVEELISQWPGALAECREHLAAMNKEHAQSFPAWDAPAWADWTPPGVFPSAIPFGWITGDMVKLLDRVPGDERLALPPQIPFELPAVLSFPQQCSLLLESRDEGRPEALRTLENVMFRVLTSMPPGKAVFTLIDPIGLGQSFAGFMHLADYDEALVGGRIWTDERQIDQCLANLNEHMETVIQKYLRNEYDSISEYNADAGEIAEPYRFLVVADFPVNFSASAVRRLMSIVNSGRKCGVYSLVFWDRRHNMPDDFSPAELRKQSVHINWYGREFSWREELMKELRLKLETPPWPELQSRILHRVGEGSRQLAHVEVPFRNIMPPDGNYWTESSASEIRVPVGQSGTRRQYIRLGKGTSQHVLIAGKTGSGKSTLLHVLISNTALWYSPDEIRFYLIDFKKGVEFKAYANMKLPHAAAIAIESDREFGLSVLQRVDQELKERGTRFRAAGVQDLTSYRAKGDDPNPTPRILVIIDEFQEFFTEDDRIAQDAALLLDRIIRQGRAFGIHVLLGTQTLGGAYTLARSTLGQMAVRIALQCSEADSYLILSDDNAAARLLSRPGEAIYNDAAGNVEGNSPFQVVWLPDDERHKCLGQVRDKALAANYQPPEATFVFEGNAPADIELNEELNRLISGVAAGTAAGPSRIWLGAPNAIKGPTHAALHRQGGNNLLIVGQQGEAAMAICAAAIIGLALQQPPEQTSFRVLDGSNTDSPLNGYLAKVGEALPHHVQDVAYRDVASAIKELADEVKVRQEADTANRPGVYIIIYGLQRFRKLRNEDEFGFGDDGDTPDQQLSMILRDGPDLGIHVIAWCDTLANVNRTFNRRVLREFDLRVLFQMSAADSMTLIDSQLATKLGLHRALYHNEQEGIMEKFNPYSLPEDGWLETVRRHFEPPA